MRLGGHDRSAAEPAATREPEIGCGKARAALRQLHVAPEAVPEPTYLETLTETDVLGYHLDIEVSAFEPDVQHTCHLAGTNVMTVRSRSPNLTEFSFRLRSQYVITAATINGTTPVTVSTLSTTTRKVILDRAYALDETFTLTIEYSGDTVSAGLGSIVVERQPNGTPVVATLSEPYYAYTWWPVKDGDVGEIGDNSDKAIVSLAVTVPGGYTVAANGVLAGVDSLSGGRQRYRWESDYPIPVYLVSFSATSYNTWTDVYTHPGGTMPVTFFIYPTSDFFSNRTAWERSVDMLATFSSLFGEYPFVDEKYGIYQFPFGGGMEHQTMTGQCCFGTSLTAHELAHQWWGDMITCRTWSDIWLNEGFATYSECLWEEFKNGVSDPIAYRSAVLARKPGDVSGSVYVPAEDTDVLWRIFDGNLSYRKGCWVLHQLRRVVGDAVFFDILADYRDAYAYSAATTEDFVSVASARYGESLSWFFDQWVYQKGAPAYRFGWTSSNVGGQDFLLLHIEQVQGEQYPAVFTMPVDIRATTAAGTATEVIWNDARSEWFVIPVASLVSNVAFDPDSWILSTSVDNTAYVPGPPKVLAVDPIPGAAPTHDTDRREITVTFHTPVNADVSDFAVVGDRTGPRSFSVQTSPDGRTAVLELTAPLPTDKYTLTIFDTLTAVDSGMALDGEVTDPLDPFALPSGDGVPGGDTVFTLAIVNAIPSVSHWGLAILGLGVLVLGTLLMRAAPGAKGPVTRSATNPA